LAAVPTNQRDNDAFPAGGTAQRFTVGLGKQNLIAYVWQRTELKSAAMTNSSGRRQACPASIDSSAKHRCLARLPQRLDGPDHERMTPYPVNALALSFKQIRRVIFVNQDRQPVIGVVRPATVYTAGCFSCGTRRNTHRRMQFWRVGWQRSPQYRAKRVLR